MDGIGQQGVHLLVSQDAEDVLGDEFVLKPVIDKIFRPDPAVKESFDLLDHPTGQPLVKPPVNPRDTFLSADESPYVVRILRHEAGSFNGMLPLVHRHLQGSDYPPFRLKDTFVRKRPVAA